MAKVTKTIEVSGKCRKCGRKNSANVRAIGEQGSIGDWTGKGKCGKCDASITLTKLNINF